MQNAVFDITVGGDYACFTRPEFKSERMTYPIITPSASRGILESVFWKPEIRWEVREIHILSPMQQTTIMRNEIGDKQTGGPIFVEEKRQQRTSLILKDVKYLIRAEIVLRPHASDPLAKYAEQFQRRLERGQCHHTPYLGTREFAAWFESASGNEKAIPLDFGIGRMLFDVAYREDNARRELDFHRHGANGRRIAHGYAEAIFFPAELKNGILRVEPELYRRLYEMEGRNA